MDNKIKGLVVLVCAILIVVLAFAVVASPNEAQSTAPPKTRVVTDLMGRDVVLPDRIDKVVVIGSIPVLNSIVTAMGAGETIASKIPESYSSEKFAYQMVFAKGMENGTVVQQGSDVNIEELKKIDPDVVFTLDKKQVDLMEKYDVTVFYLTWWDEPAVKMKKETMLKVGEVFGRPGRAQTYNDYLDAKIKLIEDRIADIPHEQRPGALMCNYKSFSSFSSARWWMEQAGGRDVSRELKGSSNFDLEKLLEWDPDYILVCDSIGYAGIYNDTRLSGVQAVKDRNVYVIPAGMGPWLATAEQPLAMQWAAKLFYPDRFSDVDIQKEMRWFYKTFYDYDLSDPEISEMLAGGKTVDPGTRRDPH